MTADKNPDYDTTPGKDSQDRVFLLSIPEANKYFDGVEELQCQPTAYAIAQGCGTGASNGCWWWLRSPGQWTTSASFVYADGDVYTYGRYVEQGDSAVRPALWIYTEQGEDVSEPQELTDSSDFGTAGSVITFGSYEQDNNSNNGKEPIEWIILDVQEGRSLLISKYALDCQQYNTQYTGVIWETCSLRTWLNDSFLKEAFSSEEQARIPTVTVTADKNPDFNTDPGEDTQDRVFLLSVPEINNYFDTNEARKCLPTAYAIAQGCYVDSLGVCWWWLRSPGTDSLRDAIVDVDGSVRSDGSNISNDGLAVRPVLWIDLNS